MLRGQRALLQHALANLLDNALACSGASPDIRVTVQAGPDAIRFSVTDNGPGIDPELEESIFKRWFTTRPGGTGLGLAVVAEAVEAHGGQVRLDRPETGGSCFTLIFPNHPAKESQ
jgi:two-component system sensor histidine kinase FlrB